jgi:hypothetical protein
MGDIAKATAADGIGIGYNTLATATRSAAFGSQAYALATRSVSLGQSRASGADSFAAGIGTNNASYGSQHAYSVALGYQAVTSADYQIALGSSTAQVKVSGAYTLPTADGTNGQVLTTDGAGAVTFATPSGGGFTSIVENYTNGTAPTVTGSDSVGIGDSTTASGSDSYAMGHYATAAGSQAIALGFLASVNSGSTTGGAALGYNATVGAGASGVALGQSYVSGSNAFAAAISSNSSSYGATGANSIAMGYQAKATGDNSRAMGYQAIASGSNSLCLSQESTASGSSSSVIGGYGNVADYTYGFASGQYAHTNGIFGKMSRANGRFAATGDAQSGTFVLRSDTTDATAEPMTTANTPTSSLNITQIILPNNSAYSFSGTIIARQQASGGSDYASWEIKGALLRDANAASTVLGNGIVNKLYATAGASAWAVALTADTTNGGLKVEVTGAAATNIRWVATVNTSEVTYA